jgi:hypothetical protein
MIEENYENRVYNNGLEHLIVQIYFSGKYDPKTFFAEYDYPYKIMHEINTPIKRGKDKGKLSEDSFCCFAIGEGIKHNEKIKKAVELALRIINDAKEQNIKIEYFDFKLFFTGIQGNMELSRNEIKWLNKLNCGITMDYVYEESE